jgi:hypothetical protein
MTPITRFVPVAAAFCLFACATTPEPVAPAPAPAPEPAPVVVPSVPAFTPPPPPAEPVKSAKTKPKPAKKTDKSADTVAAPVADAPALQVAPLPPQPVARVEAPIVGPAWLSKCANKRNEGGAILCDSDSLLANPSANVKVYAREENLAGPVANGGRIEYRPGLPRRYRLFVVP